MYGPSKASKSNGGGGGGRANGGGGVARAAPRGAKGDRSRSDDELESGAMALTREEKRQKKLLADLNKGGSSSSSPSKFTSGGAYCKHGKVLKGGAIDATLTNSFSYAAVVATEHLSVKERIAAMPNYLQRLNTVKRTPGRSTRSCAIVRRRARRRC